uniref:Non-LTR retrolelement reverse transcriptase n=1 Tax=Solanum tuberosum TaxID=4113 RepID=M1CN18_SOLTU
MFKWSPNFDPNAETSIAPIWVLLPELKYHLFKWDYLKQILAQVGNPLKEDVATVIRSRPNLAKVRVEVDLLKPLPQSVWVGHEKQGGSLKGHEQILTYEGVPSFCRTCNLQGHDMTNCNVEAKKGNRTKEEGPQTDDGKTGQIVVQNHKETAQGHNKEINRNKASTSQNVQYMDEEGFTKVTRNKNKTKTASSTNNTGNSNVDKGKGKMGKASKAPLNGGSSMNTEDKIVEEGGSKQPEVENDQDQPKKSNRSKLSEEILKKFQFILRKSRAVRAKNNNNTPPPLS